MVLYIVGGIAAVVALFILSQNSLKAKRNRVEKSWAEIDIYLQKRFDEMSSIFEQFGAVMSSEDEVYQNIAAARSGILNAQNGGTPAQKLEAFNTARSTMAVVSGMRMEAYPQLNLQMKALTASLSATSENEKQIASARKAYNSNVTSYHNALDMFPTSLVASMSGMKKDEFSLWRVEDPTVRQRPSAITGMSAGLAMRGNVAQQQAQQQAMFEQQKAMMKQQQEMLAQQQAIMKQQINSNTQEPKQ